MTLRTLARLVLVGSVTAAGLVASGAPASADFHLMKIREVGGGHPIEPDAEFVELQTFSPGQNNLAPGHTLTLYGSAGTSVTTYNIPNDVANGANQATILFANGAAEIAYGVQADFQDEFNLNASGGAVCFDMIDCVAWGTFNNILGLPVGTPASAIPLGSSLVRSIAAGCPTLLENADDTNNSATDFQLTTSPSPRPNSATPTETPCPGGPGGGSFSLQDLRTKVKGGRATITGRIDPPAPGEQMKLTFFANGSPLRKLATKSATLNAASEFKKRFKVPADSTRCKVVVRFQGAKLGQKKFRC